MAARADAAITAGIRPEQFVVHGLISGSRTLVVAAVAVLVLTGFALRISNLSAEGLSEDELNKLQAVADYRQNGLTAANGEHPFLMKALQTCSVFLVDHWNSTIVTANRSALYVTPEAALRLPSAIFGALTPILIFLLATELFGADVGLLAAALWAIDPMAIGFNRIAKEDTFLCFFFLLANVFWLRSQRIAENEAERRPQPYYWASAAAYGAMLASKYLPQMIAITISYYWIFQAIPETRWRLGKKRMFMFFVIMFAVFLILNPTILLPATWRQMTQFAGEKLVAHDSYEFMGRLYPHRITAWLKGIPWYFYWVLIAVKLPLLTVAGFAVGLPLIFRRKLGDGRYFLLFWLFFWMITFSFVGGKFTRYFTVALPAVLITTAIGVQFVAQRLAQALKQVVRTEGIRAYVSTALSLVIVIGSLRASMNATPYFRLYTNAAGRAMAKGSYYFPHDEFYDASMRDVISEISRRARPGALVASESPTLARYYAERANRPDLVCILLSDPEVRKELRAGDFIIAARGRRYFSNDAILAALQRSSVPVFRHSLGAVPSADVFELDRDFALAY